MKIYYKSERLTLAETVISIIFWEPEQCKLKSLSPLSCHQNTTHKNALCLLSFCYVPIQLQDLAWGISSGVNQSFAL